jgi:molybdopterin-containing oxidoreductase family membrane subunit
MNALSALAEFLLTGAILPLLLLAIGWLASKSFRSVLRQLLAVVYILLLIGAVLFSLTALYELIAELRSGDEYTQYVVLNRITGPYWFAYWGAVLCKGMLPQALWLKKVRCSAGSAVVLVPFLLVDYWLPLLYASLHHDYLPSSWLMMQPDYRGLALLGFAYLVVVLLGWLVVRARASKSH